MGDLVKTSTANIFFKYNKRGYLLFATVKTNTSPTGFMKVIKAILTTELGIIPDGLG